jgi:hypothetical protein
MLVVDASCLYVALVGSAGPRRCGPRLAADVDHVAPHVVNIEVFGVTRREHLLATAPRILWKDGQRLVRRRDLRPASQRQRPSP